MCRCFGPQSRPRVKRWLQRRLRSTQPIPSAGVVLTIYIVVGCSFLLCLGLRFGFGRAEDRGGAALRIPVRGGTAPRLHRRVGGWQWCRLSDFYRLYLNCLGRSFLRDQGRSGHGGSYLGLELKERVAFGWFFLSQVFYELAGFHQNHRRYVDSRVAT